VYKRQSFTLLITNKESSDSISLEHFGPLVDDWLSVNLRVNCYLFRENDKNFSNTSQFLVINKQSMYDLNCRIFQKWLSYSLAYLVSRVYWKIGYDRFRPNMVVDCPAYSEDSIESFNINESIFTKDSLCTRCNSTTIDNDKYSRDLSFEPLNTLIKYRNDKGKVNFGVLYSSNGTGLIKIN
jgi:uncharacterized protein YcbX